MNNEFTEEDINYLHEFGFPSPSELFMDVVNGDGKVVEAVLTKASKINSELGSKKGSLSKKKTKEKHMDEINRLDDKIWLIQRYKNRIAPIPEAIKTIQQSGEGIHSYNTRKYYNQPKRNAYKINQTSGQYHNLKIDLPKLFGQLKMIAYKNGKKIYDKNVDFDTVDLFTKRYYGKKKYSDLSRRVFNDINELSQIPIHRSSKKYSKIGAGVVYYNNPKDLLSRLELLGGSISAGNNSVKNEFSEIAHTLKKIKIINNEQLKNLLNEYVI